MNRGRKGADAERRARKELEADGFLVVRSAGSKGPYDLVAIKGDLVRFVSVKCYRDGRNPDLANLRDPRLPRMDKSVARVTAEIWAWKYREGFVKYEERLVR